MTLGIVFAGLFFIVAAVNFYLFREASSTLAESLRLILPHDLGLPSPNR